MKITVLCGALALVVVCTAGMADAFLCYQCNYTTVGQNDVCTKKYFDASKVKKVACQIEACALSRVKDKESGFELNFRGCSDIKLNNCLSTTRSGIKWEDCVCLKELCNFAPNLRYSFIHIVILPLILVTYNIFE